MWLLSAAGRAYVADQGNHRIQIYNADGSFFGTLGQAGQSGTGNDQFDCPQGVGFAPNGDLYVADTCNHRVQVFNANLAYIATLGVTGVPGNDNAHFSSPNDVAVDRNGVIYVAERNNNRVQVFGPDRVYRRTIGLTGQGGYNHGYFNAANRLAVDAQGILYVADGWNGRVQVYDSTGAYLTTIGGSSSNRPDQIGDAWGIAVSPDGSQVYVADYSDNSRIQRYIRGVPGWRQVNINGFGDRNASWMSSLLPFQGSLYATGYPARIWRMTAAGVWSQANTLGFGDNTNQRDRRPGRVQRSTLRCHLHLGLR